MKGDPGWIKGRKWGAEELFRHELCNVNINQTADIITKEPNPEVLIFYPTVVISQRWADIRIHSSAMRTSSK